MDELFKDNVARGELIDTLRGMGDMQRLIGRVVYGTANGRDLHRAARLRGGAAEDS